MLAFVRPTSSLKERTFGRVGELASTSGGSTEDTHHGRDECCFYRSSWPVAVWWQLAKIVYIQFVQGLRRWISPECCVGDRNLHNGDIWCPLVIVVWAVCSAGMHRTNHRICKSLSRHNARRESIKRPEDHFNQDGSDLDCSEWEGVDPAASFHRGTAAAADRKKIIHHHMRYSPPIALVSTGTCCPMVSILPLPHPVTAVVI